MVTNKSVRQADLAPLIGKIVDVFYQGERCGKVIASTAKDTVTVRFKGSYGARRIELRDVRGVYWFKKLIPVATFLYDHAVKAENKRKAGAA